ncbi:DUF4232 domain-containing protein [Streptomyces malaysiensis]|uniref:DUF4232 domain-containing protein n=1 Tax=Streptomyces malaysiensis TaxID=92644 RepID=A0A7X6AW19_STRMQ|nr:DUF4232 domain-containing protein [Streptomyces malaysiensis]NIY63741.1 hypothetical protein [Streptomyces malaysiensis]
MSSVRTSRTRLLTAAAAAAIAVLSLTACDDGEGVQSEGSSADASSSASSSDSASSGSDSSSGKDANAGSSGSKPTADGPAAKDPAGSGNGKNGSDNSGDSGKNGGKNVTCQGSNTKMVAAPLNRPVNHMLLTVTNTGSKTCYLYGYPAVRFGEAQSVPPVIEDSHPQAVVTLPPGESGYASVNLSAADGSGTNGNTEKSLTVYYQGRNGESLSSGATPSLPAKGVYVDSSIKVTYWQQSMDDAISW